jgi:hypothetical protein
MSHNPVLWPASLWTQQAKATRSSTRCQASVSSLSTTVALTREREPFGAKHWLDGGMPAEEMSCESQPTFLTTSNLPRECRSSSCCPTNSRQFRTINECNGDVSPIGAKLCGCRIEWRESIQRSIAIEAVSGTVRVKVSPRPAWIPLLVEAVGVVILGSYISRSWASMSFWIRALQPGRFRTYLLRRGDCSWACERARRSF